MKKYIIFTAISTIFLVGCRTSKDVAITSQHEFIQTVLVKQVEATIDNNIIAAKYENGTTLYYTILDNFGNVSLTWDRSSNRQSYDEGYSTYKGDIDIPSFVMVSGLNEEFIFRVVEIDDYAFYNCTNVTSINIPHSINRILANALKGCSGLVKITVNERNAMYKDIDGVLFSKDSRMLVKYPAKKELPGYTISEDVSFICQEAFQDNSFLRRITVGNFVTVISDYAFKNCSELRDVTLRRNVRVIGKQSFFGCLKLETLNSRNVFPPHNSPVVFEEATKENCRLYVPRGQMENYKRHLEWSEFKNVVEY